MWNQTVLNLYKLILSVTYIYSWLIHNKQSHVTQHHVFTKKFRSAKL